LIKQDYNLVGGDKYKDEYEADLLNRYKNTIEYYELFNNFTDRISESQYNLVDKHWGLSQVKTKDELYQILNECELLYAGKN
jgi:hypothetical protein